MRFALSNSLLTPCYPALRRKVHCRQWIYLEKMVSNLGDFGGFFWFLVVIAVVSVDIFALGSKDGNKVGVEGGRERERWVPR